MTAWNLKLWGSERLEEHKNVQRTLPDWLKIIHSVQWPTLCSLEATQARHESSSLPSALPRPPLPLLPPVMGIQRHSTSGHGDFIQPLWVKPLMDLSSMKLSTLPLKPAVLVDITTSSDNTFHKLIVCWIKCHLLLSFQNWSLITAQFHQVSSSSNEKVISIQVLTSFIT